MINGGTEDAPKDSGTSQRKIGKPEDEIEQ